ncbi:MAG: ostA-like family protein [Micavibrio sp.]|nr:ostA-like family protein [Micavibrio sp.]
MSTNSSEPIEVTADKTLEWHRGATQFIAKGNALAKQGASSIAAQALTADYRKNAGSSMEIYHLKAQGGVVLTSDDNKAYGEVGDYDLDEGLATLTGDNLRMESPDQTVTAEQIFHYQVALGKLSAIGAAKVVRPKVDGSGTDTLEAEKITATMKKNEQGEQVLDTLEAFENVVITTPTEVVMGEYGIYNSVTNKAELKGNVKIVRGQNTLEGVRAEVDMTTNVSRIFGSGSGSGGGESGRVRGVFYPGSNTGVP